MATEECGTRKNRTRQKCCWPIFGTRVIKFTGTLIKSACPTVCNRPGLVELVGQDCSLLARLENGVRFFCQKMQFQQTRSAKCRNKYLF